MGAATPRGTWAGHQQHASQAIFTMWTRFVMKFLGMWSDCEVTMPLSFSRGEQWNSERWNHLDKARESISRAGTLIRMFKLQLPFIQPDNLKIFPVKNTKKCWIKYNKHHFTILVELRERTAYVRRPQRKWKLSGRHRLVLGQLSGRRGGDPGGWTLMAKESWGFHLGLKSNVGWNGNWEPHAKPRTCQGCTERMS